MLAWQDGEPRVPTGGNVGMEHGGQEADARDLVGILAEDNLDAEDPFLVDGALRTEDGHIPDKCVLGGNGTTADTLNALHVEFRVLILERGRDVGPPGSQDLALLAPGLGLLVELGPHSLQTVEARLEVELPLRDIACVLKGHGLKPLPVQVEMLLADVAVGLITQQELPFDERSEEFRFVRQHILHHFTHGHSNSFMQYLVAVCNDLFVHHFWIPFVLFVVIILIRG
mmetsp:Transcript_108090/g.186552  ORF Transcript_108090/g.186552 Transcript_108090/m.186552 type:complete len:228 (+) Transcript_108090:394-1077(+)